MNIAGDTGKLTSALSHAEKSIDGLASRGSASLGGLGKALGSVGSIAAGFVVGQGLLKLPGLLTGMAQAAADDAQSVAKLRQAVENSGASWDSMSASLEATIATGQKMAFTDDQVRDALSMMTAQTGSAEEAQKRLGLAMDLARGANIDVATASKLLGRVTEDNVNVLGRYGITVAEGATETELFAQIQQRFGGQASAFAESTSGQFAVAKIRIEEAKEALGAQLLPVMAAVANVLATRVLPAIEGMIGGLSELVHLFSVGFGGGQIGGEFSDIEMAAFRFGQVMREDIVPAVQSVAGFLRDDLAPVLKDIASAVLPRVEELLKSTAQFLNSHREIVVAAAAAYGVWKAGMLAIMAIQFAQAVAGMVAAFMAMAQAQGVATAAMTLFNLTMLANPIVLVIVALAALVAAIIIAYKNWDTITAAVKAFADVVKGYVVDAFTAAKDKIVEIFTAMKDAVVSAVDATKDKTIGAVQAMLDFVKEYWPEIVTLLSGPFLPLVVLATDAFGIRSALIDGVKAMLDFVKEHWQEIVPLFSGPFLPLVVLATDAFGIRTALIDAFSATWDGIKAGTQAALDALVGMLQAAPGAFLSAATALGSAIKDGFISGVQGIAERLGDVLSGTGDVARAIATSVTNAINSIIDQINRLLEFSFTIPTPFGGVGVGVDAPDIPHIPVPLASGVRNFGGGLAMVGERGPELVSLPRGSDVYTASDTRRMTAGGGGGITINNLNVTSPLGTPQQIADAVRTALVQLERTGRMRRVTV